MHKNRTKINITYLLIFIKTYVLKRTIHIDLILYSTATTQLIHNNK